MNESRSIQRRKAISQGEPMPDFGNQLQEQMRLNYWRFAEVDAGIYEIGDEVGIIRPPNKPLDKG